MVLSSSKVTFKIYNNFRGGGSMKYYLNFVVCIIGLMLLISCSPSYESKGDTAYREAQKAFDGSINQAWLKSWYEKKGYYYTQDGTQEYEKHFMC